MKAIINITRIIVGVLFIFSGLVKANDPLGLSYKMQEFFEIWNEG
ncbi:MAG: DoxX family protein, partial [Bacteroidetes bacterium]|nr:DoxX family protein [Bacteroidota bacterium]